MNRLNSIDMDLIFYFEKLKNGETEYFNPIYEQTKKVVFYNILSITKDYFLSEDILQETYIAFLNNILSIKDGANILGFLLRTSKNLAIDYIKKNQHILNDDNIHLYGENDQSHIDELILLERIKKALKDDEFRIFILHAYNEMKFKDIKSLLHLPLGTVLWKYNEAIKKLQKELKDYEEN